MATRSTMLRANSRLTVEALEARDVPANFFISNGDVPGLIAALKTSNANGESDVIHLAAGGSYTVSAVADTSFGPTGLPGLLADGNLTIQGHGATLQRDLAAPKFRLLLVNGGSVTLNQVTVANGDTDPSVSPDGGGIRVQAGSLTVTKSTFQNDNASRFNGGMGGAIGLRNGTSAVLVDSTFTGNTAQSGGAVNCRQTTTLTVQHCTFTNNQALGSLPPILPFNLGIEGSGGAIQVLGFGTDSSVVTILDSTFNGNSATSGGGVEQKRGQLTVQHSTFTGNKATNTNNIGQGSSSFSGGGINTYFAMVTISDSTISGNMAYLRGGGVAAYGGMYYGAPFQGSLTMTSCTVSGNSTVYGNGGGVCASGTMLVIKDSAVSGNTAQMDGGGVCAYNSYFEPANATLQNSTISGNVAGRNGGGVSSTGYPNSYYTFTANSLLHNCTVTANTAADGGGVAHDALGTIALSSSIVAGNHDSDAAATPDLFGDVAADHSLIGDGTGGVVTGVNNLVGTTVLPINAKLGPLADNGGHTLTHALLPGSPAINAGSNVDGLSFDQRGTGFFRNAGNAPDIGAFESQNLGLSVTNVKIDDGSSQRSMVRQITITYQGLGNVTVPDFALTKLGGGSPGNFTVTDSIVGGNLVATIKFTGPGIIGGSLADGRYDLAFENTDLGAFHRLFGDVNGDAKIDATDRSAFLASLFSHQGQSNYRSYFDVNGNNFVDLIDGFQFLIRYGHSLPPMGP